MKPSKFSHEDTKARRHEAGIGSIWSRMADLAIDSDESPTDISNTEKYLQGYGESKKKTTAASSCLRAFVPSCENLEARQPRRAFIADNALNVRNLDV